jgi:hypothetical protein
MTNLPIKQLSESQRLSAKMQVEPDAKVMQGHFRRQSRLKAVQGMRTLTGQTKGIEQLVIGGFNESLAAQPASAASLWTSALCRVGAAG